MTDLYEWGQGKRVEQWSYYDKYLLWMDMYNTHELRKQREEYLATAAFNSEPFKPDYSQLWQRSKQK